MLFTRKKFIKLLKISKRELEEINEQINKIVIKIEDFDIYTSLYEVAHIYDEKDSMNIKNISYPMLETIKKILSLNSENKTINIDKFTQYLTDERDEDEIEYALILNLILSRAQTKLNNVINCFDKKAHSFYLNLICEVEKYQFIYKIRDEVTYNRYYVKNVGEKVLKLDFSNINMEKSRVSGQRRVNVRQYMACREIINEEIWNRYNLIIKDVVDAMHQYYSEYGFHIKKKYEDIVDEIRRVISEEFNYEDYYLFCINDKKIENCYSVLMIIITIWKVTENIQCERDEFVKYYFPIFWEEIEAYLESAGIEGDKEKVEKIFLYDKRKNSPYDLIYSPFIRVEKGKVYGIINICKRMDWLLFLRKRLVSGGIIAKDYGHQFEEMLSEIFKQYKWNILEKTYKIKQNGRVITDCDLIVYCKGILILIQAKAIAKGKGPHDQWSAYNTVKLGVAQAKKCTRFLEKNLEEFSTKHNVKVEKVQPLVVTANYLMNTIVIDDVPVISIDYLIAILDGAKVAVHRENVKDYYIKKNYLPLDWKIDEFIRLLYKSYEWDVDLENVKEKVKYKSCDKYIFEIPYLEEKNVKNI